MLIGGPGWPDGLPDPMHGVKDSPVYRTLRGAVNCHTTLMAGFTTVRNLGLMVYTAGFLLDVDLAKAVDQGWFPGPRIVAGRPRHHADRRPPRPHHVPGPGARDHAPERRAGNRQRGARGAQGGALPDQVRGQGDQDLGLGRRHVVQHGGRVPSSTPTRSWPPSSTRPTATACAWPPTPMATPASGPASAAGVDCIEHGSLATDDTRAAHGRDRHVPRRDHGAGRPHGGRPHPPDPAAEGGRDLPPGPSHVRPGPGAGVKIACGSDAPAIPHGTQADELIAMVDRGMTPMQALQAATVTAPSSSSASTTWAGWRPVTWPTSSPSPATPPRTSPSPRTCGSS